MSYAIPRTPRRLFDPMADLNKAVGADSFSIIKLLVDAEDDRNRSFSMGWKHNLKSDIAELVSHYNVSNWDGEDAEPISAANATAANFFVDLLPEGISLPEVAPDNTGSISLDWDLGKDKLFSVVISEGKLLFASIVGAKKFNGELPFSYELPSEVERILFTYFKR